jgi:drug/metabolite transporter (DMT)-like permease
VTAANSPAAPPPPRWLVLTAFAAVYVIWGSTYLGIRIAIETIPPFLMAGVRFLAAGAVLYGWARARGAPRPERVHWRSAFIIGALLLVFGNGAVVWAEQRVPSGITSLLVCTVPLWMVLLDWLLHEGHRPTLGVAGGVLLGLAGIAFLVGPARGGSTGAGADIVGAAVLLVASISWAYGSLWSRRAELPSAPLLAIGMEMTAGGALLIVLGLLTGEAARVHLGAISARSWGAFLYLIVFGALIGFTAYLWLVRVSTPARVSTYAFVNPVIAVALGWAVAGEPITTRTVVAATAIVGAVALITISRVPAH